jgi:hypothetical protein
MLMVIAVAFFYTWAQSREVIKIGQFAISGPNKSLSVTIISLLTILLVAGSSILVLVGLTAIIVSVHAVAHELMLDADLEGRSSSKMVGNVETEE